MYESNEKFSLVIEKYSNIFYKYEKFTNDIKNIKEKGFLYIIDIFDKDLLKNTDLKLVHKIGKTDLSIYKRLNKYNKKYIKNIEFINCTLPTEREKILKKFLNVKTTIKPVIGLEYFSKYKKLLQVLLIIISFIKEENLNYNNIFDIIENILEDINNKNIEEINIENYFIKISNNKINNPMTIESKFICEFCKKNYSNIHTLKTHQTTTKFCINIQEKINNETNKLERKIFSCDYCNKEFLLKASLKDH